MVEGQEETTMTRRAANNGDGRKGSAGTSRPVVSVDDATATLEGAGFLVHRAFPTRALDQVDPFLLLDQMGPADLRPGEAKGAPDHPHRGFETVTYMLEGRMEHRDSQGNAGSLGPGDVQWMTAGAGVVHSEMPARQIVEGGGRMHGFQLWVNLPARDKMMAPRYQEISSAHIPAARSEDGLVTVRVIAGEALGASAVIDTRTPITYLHFTIAPGGSIRQPLPADYNAFAFVVAGSGALGPQERSAGPSQVALFGAGDAVELSAAGSEPLSVLLVAGAPLREPVARYGPFVMNTREQIMEAVRDFQAGRMGTIPAEVVRS